MEPTTRIEVTLRTPPANRFPPVRRLTTALCCTLVAIGTACSNRDASLLIVGPTGLAAADASANHENTSVHWNEIARNLVASHNVNGPLASRVYALVSVAQFDAALATPGRGAPTRAAIGRASADVLTGLFPEPASVSIIAAALQDDEQFLNGARGAGGPSAGDAIGAAVAEAVLARAASDGASAANCPATPPTPASQFWHDDAVPPNPQPVLPCFGQVRTWLGLDVTQFRADPPPAFGSPGFLAGLGEVRQISDTRTAAQMAIVNAWLDGNNSFQPPGRWNLIASDLATQHRLDAVDAARMFAILNIAMMDTHVACWDRKYTYWEIRPWMVDPLITTPGGRPHHPANPSGHACAGGAGSGVLAGLFPAQGDSLLALGDEEGFSTVLSGVHYRFDVDRGLQIGRAIAATALAVPDLGDLLGISP
jgi:PAP2 superfamily